MTPQEAEYRKHVERALDAPGTTYHLLKNLARARYGWALTAHKARYYRWNTVTLSANVDMGRGSEGFFRYMYTGSTRARGQLNRVRWEDVSPFARAVFDESPSNVRKKARRPVLLRASPDLPVNQQIAAYLDQSRLDGIRFTHSASSSWREAFTFTRDGAESVMAFDHNKAGNVFCPRLERGDSDLFAEVLDALEHEDPEDTQGSPMRAAYEYAERLDGGETTISVARSDRHRDEIRVENQFGAFRRLLVKANEPSGS